MENVLIKPTPKGFALVMANEAGLIGGPPTDEEMNRFNSFWDKMEKRVIPRIIREYETKKLTEANETSVNKVVN